MVFKCTCGERYAVPDSIAPESFRCHWCGSLVARSPGNHESHLRPREFVGIAGTLLYAGLAVLAIGVLAALLPMTAVGAGGSSERPGVVMRTETAPGEIADGVLGRGELKVINDSGNAIAVRLIGPEFSNSRTVFVPAWEDGRVFGLAPGKWIAKYCTGSDWRPDERRFATTTSCAELDETIQYTESISDETLHYGAAVVRFGPSPGEIPSAHAIAAEDFVAD